MTAVSELGPQWRDSFGPEPVVAKATMDVNSGRTPKQANVYRGETRSVYPTPEYPDPARAIREDPKGLVDHWTSGSHPYRADSGVGTWGKDAKGDSVLNPVSPLNTGVHWTESPQTIPERFASEGLDKPQRGTPLSRSEVTGIKEEEHVQAARDAYYSGKRGGMTPEVEEMGNRVEQRQFDGTQPYRDLSHREDSTPYSAAVIWHGKIDARHIDHKNKTTNYEDEVNLRSDAHAPPVPVHAVQMFAHPTGESGFPGGTTPDIVQRAGRSDWDASPYQHVSPRSTVPWSTVQFPPGDEKRVQIRPQRGMGMI